MIITNVGPVCIWRRSDNYQCGSCVHREKGYLSMWVLCAYGVEGILINVGPVCIWSRRDTYQCGSCVHRE